MTHPSPPPLFPFLVTRGSKLAPDESLVDAIHHTKEKKKHPPEGPRDPKDPKESEVSLVIRQLIAGGFAGCIARTVVAPIDRVKILMQTERFILPSQSGLQKYSSLLPSIMTIVREEGFFRLWRGNLTNLIRVMPYSATQFASYDFFKSFLFQKSSLSPTERLTSGALAAITATSITHPLDVIRLRLSVQKDIDGFRGAAVQLWREGGMRSMFKGYFPTILSVSPFIAINFACFDTLKAIASQHLSSETSSSTLVVLSLGAASGIFAQTVCYPLDTVRRRMQLKGKIYNSTFDAFRRIVIDEGIRGFYKGMVPNAVKVVPNNAIRFMAYEWIKKKMGIQKKGKGEGAEWAEDRERE